MNTYGVRRFADARRVPSQFSPTCGDDFEISSPHSFYSPIGVALSCTSQRFYCAPCFDGLSLICENDRPFVRNLNMTRRLTNQDAFDGAMLTLINQGHSCVSASGRTRYRGPRGKSAIGALIPDELYVTSMEGRNVHHWLAARGSEYDALRERLGNVTPSLLDELQDLHDRIGACMPSLYRHLAVAGAQRIAHSFKLSMSLVHRCAAYQHLRGPQIFSTAGTRAFPAAARPVDVVPAPDLAAAPMPAPEPEPVTERPQNDLDLIARGIAKAIAAARGLDQPGS